MDVISAEDLVQTQAGLVRAASVSEFKRSFAHVDLEGFVFWFPPSSLALPLLQWSPDTWIFNEDFWEPEELGLMFSKLWKTTDVNLDTLYPAKLHHPSWSKEKQLSMKKKARFKEFMLTLRKCHQTSKITGINKLCSMIILNINSHSDFQKHRPTELRTQIYVYTFIAKWFLTMRPKINSWKDSIFNQQCWSNWIAACGSSELDTYFLPCVKVNAKWIKDLIPESDRWGCREYAWAGKGFLNRMPLVQALNLHLTNETTWN